MKISVIITNWNTVGLLRKYLEKVIVNSPEADEIIFCDDASEDESVDFAKSLQKKYSKLKIFSHKKNLGFGKNSNFAVKKAKGDLVVLLNSDIDPHPGYIKNTLSHFRDPKVFGVGFSELGRENYGRIKWERGYIQHQPGYSSKAHITSWLSGGSAIVRRQAFLRLGGFDSAYEPFYFEDLDIGLRAWRSGYTLIWEPKAIVEHKHEATMSKFSKKLLLYVKERNHLLTVKRNVTDPKLRSQNIFFSWLRVLGGPNYLKIILAANRQNILCPPPIVFPVRTDQEIFDLFK